jgi:hypothetical protein
MLWLELLLDPKLSRKMGESALQKAAAKNTWQDYDDRLLDANLGKLSYKELPYSLLTARITSLAYRMIFNPSNPILT